MTIYIGNLPYNTTAEKLREVFARYGDWNIKNISMPTDKMTGQGKGFAFIDCEVESEEDDAIVKLTEAGPSIDLRTLRIVKAESKGASDRNGGSRSPRSFGGRPSDSQGYGSSRPRSSNGSGFRGASGNRSGSYDSRSGSRSSQGSGGFRNKSKTNDEYNY